MLLLLLFGHEFGSCSTLRLLSSRGGTYRSRWSGKTYDRGCTCIPPSIFGSVFGRYDTTNRCHGGYGSHSCSGSLHGRWYVVHGTSPWCRISYRWWRCRFDQRRWISPTSAGGRSSSGKCRRSGCSRSIPMLSLQRLHIPFGMFGCVCIGARFNQQWQKVPKVDIAITQIKQGSRLVDIALRR